MAHLSVAPVVVPEIRLLDLMKVALADAVNDRPAVNNGRCLNGEEVMRLLQNVCDELTRKDVCTQVCTPKFAAEFGGAEWVQVMGLLDNRWVEVIINPRLFLFLLF